MTKKELTKIQKNTIKKVNEILKAGFITEKEILLLKSRLNNDRIDYYLIEPILTDSILITPKQAKKGLNWLNNLYKSPTRKIRKNNPFGYREVNILDNFDNFCLHSFQNTGNAFINYFVPVYSCNSQDNGFIYYVDNNRIQIIG